MQNQDSIKVCLISNKYIPFVFAYITSRMRLWSTPVDTHPAFDIRRMTGWHLHPHQGPLGAENDCSCSVQATRINIWLVSSVCDGHSFCVNLRLSLGLPLSLYFLCNLDTAAQGLREPITAYCGTKEKDKVLKGRRRFQQIYFSSFAS